MLCAPAQDVWAGTDDDNVGDDGTWFEDTKGDDTFGHDDDDNDGSAGVRRGRRSRGSGLMAKCRA